MSGASPTRAAVFTSSPQSVEIYERGAWWPGSMLGWRHDSRGRCQAWVRVEFTGVAEDAWVDLGLLRLPQAPAERHLTLAREPRGGRAARRQAGSGDAASSQASDVTQTQHLPLVREGGARPTAPAAPAAGGRRRAAETGEQSEVAVASSGVLAAPGRSSGRHRAPVGRHRAADTGVLGAMTSDLGPGSALASADRSTPPPPRSELPPAGPVVRPAPVRSAAGADLLTRPMRLEDAVGTVRRSRRESLAKV